MVVVLDPRLNWNKHIGRIFTHLWKNMKGKTKNGVLTIHNVDQTHDNICFLVFVAKDETSDHINRLGKVQRLASQRIGGTMRKPTAALEPLLNHPPLHLAIMGKADQATGAWIKQKFHSMWENEH